MMMLFHDDVHVDVDDDHDDVDDDNMMLMMMLMESNRWCMLLIAQVDV